MKKRDFEKLLREAVYLDAEEQGRKILYEQTAETVPPEARTRFAAMLEQQKEEGAAAAANEPQARPPKHERMRRILTYALTACVSVAACAALLLVVIMPFVSKKNAPTRPADATAAATNAPQTADPTEPPVLPAEPPEVRPDADSPETLAGTWTERNPDAPDDGPVMTIEADGTVSVVEFKRGVGRMKSYAVSGSGDGLVLNSERETLALVCDPDAPALLTIRSDFACRTYYRDPSAAAQAAPHTAKTVERADLNGVWTLERAETAGATFDLSHLDGHLMLDGNEARYVIRIADRSMRSKQAYTVADSMLSVTADGVTLTGFADAESGELRLTVLIQDAASTGAEPVLVFSRADGVAQPVGETSLNGYWSAFDGSMYAEGWDLHVAFKANRNVIIQLLRDGTVQEEKTFPVSYIATNGTVWFGTYNFRYFTVNNTHMRMICDFDTGTIRIKMDDEPYDELMILRRQTGEDGKAVPPDDASELSTDVLEGQWVSVSGAQYDRGGRLKMAFKGNTVRWVQYGSWTDPRHYLVHNGIIELYIYGEPESFYAELGYPTLCYHPEDHTIRVVKDGVELYVLQPE